MVAVAGVVIGVVVVLGLAALVLDRDDDTPSSPIEELSFPAVEHDEVAAQDLVVAWERWRTASFVTDGTWTRTLDESDAPLREALVNDRYPDGRPVYTPLVAVSLLVFFVFALQCMSTLAIARRELNSWMWPAVMWLYMTGLAWIASFIVYQGGLALGLG